MQATTLVAARTLARRRLALVLLVLAVLLAHALLGSWVADTAVGLGAGRAAQGPPRLRAIFIAELRPTAPPAVAPRVLAPPARRPTAAARPAAPPASAPALPVEQAPKPDPKPAPAPALAQPAPAPEAAASEAAPGTAAVVPDTPAPAPASAPASASASAIAAAPAASTPETFEWPRSTRLSYRLSGNYRGPVDGQASVEWLREGNRYQVHLEVSVGPAFAPLLSRRMSSDGEIGAEGLVPLRYDEETKAALRASRTVAVRFEGPVVRLANGSEVARPAGVQDTASQFVQLTWLFTTQPERLRPGQSVELMLALPRRVDMWVYDVLASEPLVTPAGTLDAVHVKPRRPAKSTGDLAAEVWIAPSLQYLPVRILIRQDAENFVDLLLERLPQQSGDPPVR